MLEQREIVLAQPCQTPDCSWTWEHQPKAEELR